MATAAARRYAKAVFELAQSEGEIDRWGPRLAAIRQLFANPKVAAVLSNPTIAIADREGLVVSASEAFDEEGTNLARMLVEAGRIGEAGAIEAEYHRLADLAAGRVRATVTTAIELGVRDQERVAEELSKRLHKEVRLSVVVDPAVIGGLKMQYGDRVIDATVAARLEQLRRRLAAT